MNFHPLSELLPMMSGAELADLATSVKSVGLTAPIVTHEGMILDGRNRWKACQAAGVEPRFVEFHQNGASPLDFVITQNLHRRHLTDGQRACVAVAYKEALYRKPRARRPDGRSRRSSEISAALFNVSASMVDRAAVLFKRDPEMFAKAKAGGMKVNEAYYKLEPRPVHNRKEKVETRVPSLQRIEKACREGGWKFECTHGVGMWCAHFYHEDGRKVTSEYQATFTKAVEQAMGGMR